MIVKLLTEHHLMFLSLKGGCRGSSESTLVKMSNCWKSHAAAHVHMSNELAGKQKCAINFISWTRVKTGILYRDQDCNDTAT